MTICARKLFFQQRDSKLKEGGGAQGVEVLGEHLAAMESFLCLKTQLHSLCLVLVSQVQWKFAAEAFIPEHMTGGDVNERAMKYSNEQAQKGQCRRALNY